VKSKPLHVIQRTEPKCAWLPRPIPFRVTRRESLLVFCCDATVPVRLGEYGECRRPTSHSPVDLLGEKSSLNDRRIRARQNRGFASHMVCVVSKHPALVIGTKFEDGGRRQPPVLLIPLYLSSARTWDFVSVPATFSPSRTRTQSPAVFFAIFRASFVRGIPGSCFGSGSDTPAPVGPRPPSQPVC
jgi:hypothetical protein